MQNYAMEGAGLIAKKRSRRSGCQNGSNRVTDDKKGNIYVPSADTLRGSVVILSLGVNDLAATNLTAEDYYHQHWLPFVKSQIIPHEPLQLVILLPAQHTIEKGGRHYAARYGQFKTLLQERLPNDLPGAVGVDAFSLEGLAFDGLALHPKSYALPVKAIQESLTRPQLKP